MTTPRSGLRPNQKITQDTTREPSGTLRIEDGAVHPHRLSSWSHGSESAPRQSTSNTHPTLLPKAIKKVLANRLIDAIGGLFVGAGMLLGLAIATYDASDPSFNTAITGDMPLFTGNWLGQSGAIIADLCQQFFGIAGFLVAIMPVLWGLALLNRRQLGGWFWRIPLSLGAMTLLAVALGTIPAGWMAQQHPGGAIGTISIGSLKNLTGPVFSVLSMPGVGIITAILGIGLMMLASGLGLRRWVMATRHSVHGTSWVLGRMAGGVWAVGRTMTALLKHKNRDDFDSDTPIITLPPKTKKTPKATIVSDPLDLLDDEKPGIFQRLRQNLAKKPDPLDDLMVSATNDDGAVSEETSPRLNRTRPPVTIEAPRTANIVVEKPVSKGIAAPEATKNRKTITPPAVDDNLLALSVQGEYTLPPLGILHMPGPQERMETLSPDALQSNAQMLESVLNDFGVNGAIVKIRPGPVVTLYELEPAPGTKSSRVIGLADDIARSMSAISARVAVVPGRNVIGIELPNEYRQTVWLRELLCADAYTKTQAKLPLVLGKDIGGEGVIADLARMPHLLVAGTTGSGKSVAVNTMILSLLYRLTPEQCRFIMIDPKMLELSVYADIPHLLTPVVTEPKKAVVALKWTVREMEDRYRAMSKMGVRNIDGYNNRVAEARKKGEHLTRKLQTGFDPETGKPVFEEEPIDLRELPFIVVIVDEFADLMLVAGKEIEGCIQRLAQMARAAGIHLIMATQRPSVDVITGTIKANFPTRISFAVTSKIDSRTILGEQGAEQLLGQGDMLYMASGGRVTRVHGPFVKDDEVEAAVAFLKTQGEPDYMDSVTIDKDGDDFAESGEAGDEGGSGDGLFDRAVDLVARERKASTSFIQRHLQIGYNRAARIIEQMEKQGMVSSANHVGKREVLLPEVD